VSGELVWPFSLNEKVLHVIKMSFPNIKLIVFRKDWFFILGKFSINFNDQTLISGLLFYPLCYKMSDFYSGTSGEQHSHQSPLVYYFI